MCKKSHCTVNSVWVIIKKLKKKILKFFLENVSINSMQLLLHSSYKVVGTVRSELCPDASSSVQFETISETDKVSAHAFLAQNLSRVNRPKFAKMAFLKPSEK